MSNSRYRDVSTLKMHGKLFQNEFKTFKKEFKCMCIDNDWTLVEFSCGYESISIFIRDNKTGNYVYCSKQDWNTGGLSGNRAWRTDNWLVRECRNRKDFVGGINQFFPYSQISKGIRLCLQHQKIIPCKKILAHRHITK